MLRLAFFCVNYNTYSETKRFLESLSAAQDQESFSSVDVFICDNTEDNVEVIDNKYDRVNVTVFSDKKNRGYFGGIGYMMQKVALSMYDYITISNVDVEINKTALAILADKQYPDNIGFIAPQIYSLYEKRDRNPKIVSRYSRNRIILFKLFFRYPILHYFYTKTLYRRKKMITHSAGEIYGGHGSFIILTRSYFRKCGIIDYPIFLYGEEIYLAEKCRMAGLKVIYDPSIRIEDKDHASTSRMKRSQYYKCNYEAMDYILRTFYSKG